MYSTIMKDIYILIGFGGMALMAGSRLIDRHNRKYVGNRQYKNRQETLDKVSYALTVSSLACAVTSFIGYFF